MTVMLVAAASLPAMGDGPTINGVVLNDEDQPVEGVEVELCNLDTEDCDQMETDENGEFSFLASVVNLANEHDFTVTVNPQGHQACAEVFELPGTNVYVSRGVFDDAPVSMRFTIEDNIEGGGTLPTTLALGTVVEERDNQAGVTIVDGLGFGMAQAQNSWGTFAVSADAQFVDLYDEFSNSPVEERWYTLKLEVWYTGYVDGGCDENPVPSQLLGTDPGTQVQYSSADTIDSGTVSLSATGLSVNPPPFTLMIEVEVRVIVDHLSCSGLSCSPGIPDQLLSSSWGTYSIAP